MIIALCVTCPSKIGPGCRFLLLERRGPGDGEDQVFNGADHPQAARGGGAACAGQDGRGDEQAAWGSRSDVLPLA